MGTDFYPRLTGVIHDHAQAIRTVNEQTEIGILLALPGLLGTLAFAPFVMELFYSQAFLPAADLLPWFLLDIFGRVISWPLGYIQLAKGAARWFVFTESVFIALQFSLMYWLVTAVGLSGAAYAFAAAYACYTVGMLWIGYKLIGIKWSPQVVRLLLISAILMATAAVVTIAFLGWLGMTLAGSAAACGGVISLRGLSRRLGQQHPLIRTIGRLPFSRWLMPFDTLT